MAYEVFDTNGRVSHGPSIKGMDELRHHLNKIVDARHYPQTNMFFKHGYATSPIAFKVELGQLLQKAEDENCKASIKNLIEASSKCKEIVILRN